MWSAWLFTEMYGHRGGPNGIRDATRVFPAPRGPRSITHAVRCISIGSIYLGLKVLTLMVTLQRCYPSSCLSGMIPADISICLK